MSQVKVRMDRSRTFSTVHGDRAPDDPHARVHFYQDGLPFDAQGLLLPEAIPASDKDARDRAERLIKRATRSLPKPAPVQDPPPATQGSDDDKDDADNDGNEGGGGGGEVDVNLEAWLRGEQKYPWFAITKAIRTRYARNITNTEDAVNFLVTDQGVVAKDNLADAFKSMIAG